MGTPQVIIDTDIVIDQLRLSSGVLDAALRHFDCGITAISIYELNAVPHLSDRQRAALDRLLSVMEPLPFDAPAAERAAAVWRDLSAAGMLIGLRDILLAGICLVRGLPLLTRNHDHFGRVAGLGLISSDQIRVMAGSAPDAEKR